MIISDSTSNTANPTVCAQYDQDEFDMTTTIEHDDLQDSHINYITDRKPT